MAAESTARHCQLGHACMYIESDHETPWNLKVHHAFPTPSMCRGAGITLIYIRVCGGLAETIHRLACPHSF